MLLRAWGVYSVPPSPQWEAHVAPSSSLYRSSCFGFVTNGLAMKYFGGPLSIPEDKLRIRYFKVSIFKQPRSDGALFQNDPLIGQSYSIPNSTPINPGSMGIRLQPVGACIYCGATEYIPGKTGPLSDEHIISGALGGNIVLQEASCKACANYTSGVESAVLNDLFWAPRHRLRLRSRTRKRERNDFAFSTVVDGKHVALKLPLERHPTTLFMPTLLAPSVLANRARGRSGIHGLWMHWLNDPSLANADEILTAALDTVLFCQFIAKIGHAFVVAAVRTDMFVPLLATFICRKFDRTEEYPECYHLVGGHPKRYPTGKALHELGLTFTERSRDWFLSVQIRLFANLAAPIYVAVVGRLNPGSATGYRSLPAPRLLGQVARRQVRHSRTFAESAVRCADAGDDHAHSTTFRCAPAEARSRDGRKPSRREDQGVRDYRPSHLALPALGDRVV